MTDLFGDTEADAAYTHAWARERRNPLRVEMQAATLGLEFRQAEVLNGMGVPVAQLHAGGLCGVARATIDARGFWTPDEAGQPHVILPVEEQGAMIDLVAFDPRKPDLWACRTGTGWALGHDAIVNATQAWPGSERLELHPTPLEWMRAGGTGACVWRWCDESRAALRECTVIDVQQPEFQRWLRTELLRLPRLPEVELRRLRRDAA